MRRRRLGEEPFEPRLQLLPPAPVLEVVGLDAGDQRDLGAELEERAVALVGLDDEPPTVTAAAGRRVPDGVPAGAQLAADDERRPETGLAEHEREHRRRRRLAVASGDGDRPPLRADPGEGVGPPQERDAAPERLGDLDVRVGDRRRPRDGLDIRADVLGTLPHRDLDTEGAQPVEHRRLLDVAAGHLVPHGGEHRRDRGHPRPGGADDVHGARPAQVERHAAPLFACSSTTAATASAASGRPIVRAASPISRSFSGPPSIR